MRKLPVIWKRELEIPLEAKSIITLTGVRRSGKTYHLFRVMQKLRERGVSPARMLYINFEDERLDLTIDELDLILQVYRELYPEQELSDCYFLFDEIHEVEGWEKFVTRIHGNISKKVFVTGSNSTLLSQEIATALRGRTISFEVYPLSFSEFVNIQEPKLDKDTSYGKAKLVGLFELFMKQGGFPELMTVREDRLKEKILQEYFDVMVLRDLIERYNISQPAILKYFCKRVVGNSAGEFSIHKIYNELKSQGYKISKDTIYSFQDYVESVYLSKFISKYSRSVVKRELSQKKSYVIDQGLGAALDYKLSQDKSRLLETSAALEFIKRGERISYLQNGFECDFVLIEREEVRRVLQVAYEISDEDTKQREVKGLLKAAKQFGLDKGTIITYNQQETLEREGVKIEIVPAWSYFG